MNHCIIDEVSWLRSLKRGENGTENVEDLFLKDSKVTFQGYINEYKNSKKKKRQENHLQSIAWESLPNISTQKRVITWERAVDQTLLS